MFQKRGLTLAIGLGLAEAAIAATSATSCVTTTIQSTVPTATALAFQSYSYCGGILDVTAYINDTDYGKIVDLYYDETNGLVNVLGLGYVETLTGSINPHMQIWAGSVNDSTIAELAYITYNATDVGLNYYEPLDIALPKTKPSKCACSTYVVEPTHPTNGAVVAIRDYAYCDGSLYASAYIENVDYGKLVYLTYTDERGVATALTTVELNYVASIDDNYEIWASTTPDIFYDGISSLINLTLDATDINQVYNASFNVPVKASGCKVTTSAVPAPYASPTGFSSDIATFVAAQQGSEAYIAKKRMFDNIEVTNAAVGTIVAAQSYANPDYGYNWVRDSSLTMDVVNTLYAATTDTKQKAIYEALFFNYSMARATQQTDPDLLTGLGEPKFNLNDSTYTLPWCRPQNDGPATAAITLMEFSNAYLNAGGDQSVIIENIYDSTMNPNLAPVMKDLLFVASNWSSPSCDLWEEEISDHFYTRNVQYRALTMGVTFALRLGDSATASTLQTAAAALKPTLSQFWDPNRGFLLYSYGPVMHSKYSYKDSAVILGMLHGSNDVYTFTTDKVLASALAISTVFLQTYAIAAANHTDAHGRPLGVPIGRYPEDVYNGNDITSLGNPWYLLTSAFSEYFYRAATAFTASRAITVTKISLPFWTYYSPQSKVVAGATYKAGTTTFNSLIESLQGWGDAYLRTVKVYTPANGHLSEEINRDTGVPQGAIDLTWSYAAFLTAAFARAEAAGETGYVETLANFAVAPNATGVYH